MLIARLALPTIEECAGAAAPMGWGDLPFLADCDKGCIGE
jgi:hypothetical protein